MTDGSDWLGRWRKPPKAGTGTSLTARSPAPRSSADADSDPASDSLDAKALIDEMREAVRRAGILPDDPMMPMLAALAKTIKFMAERGGTSDRVVASASERIYAALVEARHTADAEAERFRGALQATEADIIRRVAGSIAASADKALTRRVKTFDRNTALLAGAVLFGVASAGLGGGYIWGGNDARADIHETEAGLHAAFLDSPAEARGWMLLMTWNRLKYAPRTCASQAYGFGSRLACSFAFWNGPEPPDPPRNLATP
jgi:hypothetical protein